jgi:hypothetical protein
VSQSEGSCNGSRQTHLAIHSTARVPLTWTGALASKSRTTIPQFNRSWCANRSGPGPLPLFNVCRRHHQHTHTLTLTKNIMISSNQSLLLLAVIVGLAMATALDFQVVSTHLRNNANKQLPFMLEMTLPIEMNNDDHRALKRSHRHEDDDDDDDEDDDDDDDDDEVTLIDLMEDAEEEEEEEEEEEAVTLTDGMEAAEEEELEEIMEEDEDEEDDEITVAAASAQEGMFSVGSKESEGIFSVGGGGGDGDDKNDGVWIGMSLGAAAIIVLAVIVARSKPKEQLKHESLVNLQDQDDPEVEVNNTTSLSKKAVGRKNSTPSFSGKNSVWSIRHSKTSAHDSRSAGNASNSIRPSNKKPPASAFQQHGKKNVF